MKLFGGVVMCD